MTELTDSELYAGIRTYWESHDPVPDGMVARLQVAAALAASDTDLDIVPDLTPGMLRLRLEPSDGSTSFMTPAFEI